MSNHNNIEFISRKIRETIIEMAVWEAKIARREFVGKDVSRENEHMVRLSAELEKARDWVAPVVVVAETTTTAEVEDTWSDIDWNRDDTCVYDGISYTCKKNIVKTYASVKKYETAYSVATIHGLTSTTLVNYNQAIFSQYQYLPVGTVLNIVEPSDTKRKPDYANSKFWEVTQ